MTRIALDDPRLYLNRHLQWMAFNHRVLEEARDPGTPLLERVKFLAITANNLDGFVEIRVSSFLQKIEHGGQSVSPDGLTPSEELDRVSASMHHFVREQYRCWNDELLPGLAKHQIRVLTVDSADWMPRNLYERVEVLFPLKDPSLRERISKEILSSYLADNRKARLLGPDGQYTHVRAAGTASPFPSRNI